MHMATLRPISGAQQANRNGCSMHGSDFHNVQLDSFRAHQDRTCIVENYLTEIIDLFRHIIACIDLLKDAVNNMVELSLCHKTECQAVLDILVKKDCLAGCDMHPG